MAKAKAEITIFNIKDVKSVTRYYLLQSSTAAAPSKPTTITPGSNWKTTEPSYTDGSTNTLYFVDLTIMSDGKTFSYSDVSKSSSYEAAKSAWNKANNAQNTANSADSKAQGIVDNIYTPDTTTINGAKITTGSIKAAQIDVANLFAQDIKATGSIEGGSFRGCIVETESGRIGGFTINDWGLENCASQTVNGVTTAETFEIRTFDSGEKYMMCIRKKRSGGGTIYIDPDIFTLERNGNINTAGNYYHNGYLIGEQLYKTTTSTKTLSNNTWTDTGVSIDLTAGTYVITGFVSFGQAPKGKRGIRMRNSNGNYADESTNMTVVNSSSTAGDSISLTTTLIYSTNDSVTIYLQALQQSGGNLALNKSNIKAVRIA